MLHKTSLGNEMMTVTKMDVVGGKQFCINLVHWPEAPTDPPASVRLTPHSREMPAQVEQKLLQFLHFVLQFSFLTYIYRAIFIYLRLKSRTLWEKWLRCSRTIYFLPFYWVLFCFVGLWSFSFLTVFWILFVFRWVHFASNWKDIIKNNSCVFTQ